ncbi:hypothetical protein PI124_g14588 [Phytophthora idaei]|nr:hypothetical protein PI125_g15860 [Phytophthora idaei]KAG3240513.1 hypothetical protein PI124_g14588 [Phytophthora idaei]
MGVRAGDRLQHGEFSTVAALQHAGGVYKVALRQRLTVIKRDWVNYALQTAAGTIAAVVNAVELLAIMDDTLVSCTNRRGLLAKVNDSLSIPYEPYALVTVIRPDTLALVSVPRQHVVN